MGAIVGALIKNIRKSAKITSAEVSNSIAISKSYYDYIESGERAPQADVLAKLAVVLNISFNALLETQEKEKLILFSRNMSKALNTLDCPEKLAVSKAAVDMLNARVRDLSTKTCDFIENDDVSAVINASMRLSPDDLARLRRTIEALHPEAFC